MKKTIYVYRHAEKGEDGQLTDKGRQDSVNEGKRLREEEKLTYFFPHSTEVSRAKETIELIVQGFRCIPIPMDPEHDLLKVRFTKEQDIRFKEAAKDERNKSPLQQGFAKLARDMLQYVKNLSEFIENLPDGENHIAVTHTPIPESFLYLIALATVNGRYAHLIWDYISFAPLDYFKVEINEMKITISIKTDNYLAFSFDKDNSFTELCEFGYKKYKAMKKMEKTCHTKK